MDIKKQIGMRIRKARETLGISQEELGFRIGKSQDAISDYETGRRGIQSSELPIFANALEVPIAYFYGDIAPDEELLALYEKLPPRARRMAIEYLYLLEKEFAANAG